MLKKCSKCKEEKDISDFNKNTMLCKECAKQYKKEYSELHKEEISEKHKEYYKINSEKIIEKNREYYKNNKDKKKEYDKIRSEKNKEERKVRAKVYYQNNKQKYIDRNRKLSNMKYKNDPSFKLRNRLTCEIGKSLKNVGSSKKGHSILEYLPYTIQELKIHLENLFKLSGNEWMNWNNWKKYNTKTWIDGDESTYTWNIDHIIPQSDLPFASMEDENFKKCWALENLRPYSAKQNIIDGAQRIRHSNG